MIANLMKVFAHECVTCMVRKLHHKSLTVILPFHCIILQHTTSLAPSTLGSHQWLFALYTWQMNNACYCVEKAWVELLFIRMIATFLNVCIEREREREPLQLQSTIRRLGCHPGSGIGRLYPCHNQGKSLRKSLTAKCAKNATYILSQRNK